MSLRTIVAAGAGARSRTGKASLAKSSQGIADEAGPTAGFSAEVAAVFTEDAASFASLKGPGEAGECPQGADTL
jgi:hypothetical protein